MGTRRGGKEESELEKWELKGGEAKANQKMERDGKRNGTHRGKKKEKRKNPYKNHLFGWLVLYVVN